MVPGAAVGGGLLARDRRVMACTTQGRSCSLWSSCSRSPGCSCVPAARHGGVPAARRDSRGRGAASSPGGSPTAAGSALSRSGTRTARPSRGHVTVTAWPSSANGTSVPLPAAPASAAARRELQRVPELLPPAAATRDPAQVPPVPVRAAAPGLPPAGAGGPLSSACGGRGVPAAAPQQSWLRRAPRKPLRHPGPQAPAHPPAPPAPPAPLSPRCGTSPARPRPRLAVPHRAQSRPAHQPSPNLRPFRESS